MDMEHGASSLWMAAVGEPQDARIDPVTILNMVMKALGAGGRPVLSEVPCGPLGNKIGIKLDVSCIHKSRSVTVYGMPSTSSADAQHSAVIHAIKYLNENHRVQIMDYSSTVVSGLGLGSMFEKVSAAISSFVKIIVMWESIVEKTKKVCRMIEEKDAQDVVDQEYERWQRYGETKDFLNEIAQVHGVKVAELRMKASELTEIFMTLQKGYADRQEAKKNFVQTVSIELKDILNGVLRYLGCAQAYYTNTPVGGDVMKATAKFFIPQLAGLRICGNIEIPGKADEFSRPAEEKAAYQALLFMEQSYKLRVIDINHAERVTAETEHKDVVLVLDEVLFHCKKIKESWVIMLKSMKCISGSYNMDPLLVYGPLAVEEKIEAYKFCGSEVMKLEADAVKVFAECSQALGEMEGLQETVNELKKKF